MDRILDGAGHMVVNSARKLLGAKPPVDEQEAVSRRKVMRKARSKKKRPLLLAELERRYINSP